MAGDSISPSTSKRWRHLFELVQDCRAGMLGIINDGGVQVIDVSDVGQFLREEGMKCPRGASEKTRSIIL